MQGQAHSPPNLPKLHKIAQFPPEGVPPACTWRVERGMGGGGLVVGAQDYAAARLCFSEGHRTLLPPSCNFLQKAGCNVDAPLGPEQDLKLLFLCNPKDPLRISFKTRLDYVGFSAILWAMGLPLHLAVAPPTPPPPPLSPLNSRCAGFPQRGYPQPAHGELRGEWGEGGLLLAHRTMFCSGHVLSEGHWTMLP